MSKFRNAKGFTLIELMIVVVIIGILAAIAIPKFGAASDRAKEKEADGILKQIYTLQSAYHAANGGFAATFGELKTVGWEEPPVLSNYIVTPVQGDATKADSDPFCLAPSGTTPSHKERCVDLETGVLSSK